MFFSSSEMAKRRKYQIQIVSRCFGASSKHLEIFKNSMTWWHRIYHKGMFRYIVSQKRVVQTFIPTMSSKNMKFTLRSLFQVEENKKKKKTKYASQGRHRFANPPVPPFQTNLISVNPTPTLMMMIEMSAKSQVQKYSCGRVQQYCRYYLHIFDRQSPACCICQIFANCTSTSCMHVFVVNHFQIKVTMKAIVLGCLP